jgi:hypothetical protein
MLMSHARSSGVKVYENTKVTSLSFSATNSSQPVSASWTHVPPPPPLSPPATPISGSFQFDNDPVSPTSVPIAGQTTFDYLVDASGRNGIMSTRYLKNRHFNESLKNVALWGYWENVEKYGLDTPRDGAPWFEALTGTYLPEYHTRLRPIAINRRVWLGLVHTLARWNNFGWRCHSPKPVHVKAQRAWFLTLFQIFYFRFCSIVDCSSISINSCFRSWCRQLDRAMWEVEARQCEDGIRLQLFCIKLRRSQIPDYWRCSRFVWLSFAH